MASKMAFVVGSRRYGEPKPESDIDLVVYVSPDDYQRLRDQADDEWTIDSDAEYDGLTNPPMRFGGLNLIVATNDKQYAAWRKGLKAVLKLPLPVSRAMAKSIFYDIRHKLGLVYE